jgi:hypothetical protein
MNPSEGRAEPVRRMNILHPEGLVHKPVRGLGIRFFYEKFADRGGCFKISSFETASI